MKKNYTLIIFLLAVSYTNAQTEKEKRERNTASKTCEIGYDTWSEDEPIIEFEKALMSDLGYDYNHPDKNKIISEFFNKYADSLICEDDSFINIRSNEHIFKRSIARGQHIYIKHVAKTNAYTINLNFYEIVDGKKETILDYIDKMLVDEKATEEDYDIDEIKLLRTFLENRGAKRGWELGKEKK